MLAHRPGKSILLAFQVKLFAKHHKAMQLWFHQSYAVTGKQNFHYFHPTPSTKIKMEGISSVSTYSLVLQTFN